jgi:gliding-associated putative ABC transporter substrate-binding component GldG
MATLQKYLTQSKTTLYAILMGCLVLLNLISTQSFFRIDLTKNRAYSLSQTSKQFMRSLKDPITVKAFFSANLPAPYSANARYLRDMLDDYRAYSKGRLNFTFIDPADNPEYEREARSLGVYEVQLTVVERDKFEQKKSFMGVAFIYKERKEVIPLIQNVEGLEYQITSGIKKLLQTSTKVVGITQGHGEPSLFEDLDNYRQILSQNYEVVPVDLKTGTIPDRLDALVVAGPTESIVDDKLYAIENFLRSGKNIVMLAPMVKPDAKTTMQGMPVDSGLARLLGAWGVRLEKNMVLDTQCQKISVAQRGPDFIMQNIVPYPFFPLSTTLDKASIVLKNLDSITLPFVSSFSFDEGLMKNHKLTGSVLIKSSDKAWEQRDFFMLSPQFIRPPARDQLKQYNLVGTVTGAFPSMFSKENLPQPGNAGEVLPAFVEQAKPARLLFSSTRELLQNDFINARGEGTLVQFAQNMVDWAAQDDALVEIRSKGLSAPELGQIGDMQRQMIKYFNMVGLPLLVIFFGLYMWRHFENRRQQLALQFQKNNA